MSQDIRFSKQELKDKVIKYTIEIPDYKEGDLYEFKIKNLEEKDLVPLESYPCLIYGPNKVLTFRYHISINLLRNLFNPLSSAGTLTAPAAGLYQLYKEREIFGTLKKLTKN